LVCHIPAVFKIFPRLANRKCPFREIFRLARAWPNPKLEGVSTTIEVAAGVVYRDGRLLIAQRPPGAHLGGTWEFPGGKRAPRESFEECLHRELKEELGIEVSVADLFETVTHAYPEKTVCLRFYRCRWARHEPRALGCSDWRWVWPEALGNFEFPAADARLVQRLIVEPPLSIFELRTPNSKD
jgi:mutator protein MutT